MHLLRKLHHTAAVQACGSCKALFELHKVGGLQLSRITSLANPCGSLSRQFCLDQKLSICKDASLGDADPDTATGNEGDIQTRCFRELWCLSSILWMLTVTLRTRLCSQLLGRRDLYHPYSRPSRRRSNQGLCRQEIATYVNTCLV